MSLKDIGEFGFIEKISKGCLIRPNHVLKAIGDDAAAFTLEDGAVALVTTDLMVERVHFLRDATTGFNLGYKAMAVNLSDIAAMGGKAREAFVSIAIPRDCPVEFLEDIYQGMKDLAKRHEVNILGGDTTASLADLVINVCVVGSARKENILYRDAAVAGDIVCCAGFLGQSRAGLHLILNRIPADSPELKILKEAHLLPRPCLEEGWFLSHHPGVHAAIDVSDGLSSDLGHIIKESRAGARIDAEKFAVSPALKFFCRKFGLDATELILAGGEDYALIVTVSPEQIDALTRSFENRFHYPLQRIGEITDTQNAIIVFPDKDPRPLSATGWDHFSQE